MDIKVAQANFFTAQAELIEAQNDLKTVVDGPDAGEIALLKVQIAKGYRDYEIFSAGPEPDEVAVAEARVTNARAQLAAAEASLSDSILVAPFDGVISELQINPNEWVAPGSLLVMQL